MKTPFSSQQLKEMVDKIEAIHVHNLWTYNVAASNTRDARRSLFSTIRDDDKRRLVFSEDSYSSQVESGIKFLQKKRDWRHILRPRRGLLLRVQYSVIRRWKNGVARPMIYCAA
jgi:hypothetical protein